MQNFKAHMSALAGSLFLVSSRAHWRIPAILSGTLMIGLALSACAHKPAAPSEPVAGPPPAQGETATAESALHTFSNPDTVAWLTVPGTNIDGPVQQGPDNDYYLRRDSDGNKDFRGCYFADADAIVSLANLSRNLVIYGHTFTDGWDGGFAQLDKYLDADWALEHTDIQVEIGGSVLEYEVCSVGYCDTEETSLPIYCNLDDEAYRYLIEDANKRNEVPGLQELSVSDNILTLATCTENENIRLVVVAKQKYDTIGTSKEDAS